MADQTIGEIALGESSRLIFSMSEWRGRFFASVRKFVATQKYKGPTKSGLVMNNKILRELTSVLTKLEQSIPPQEEHEFGRLPKSGTEHIKIATLPSENENGLPAVDVREFVDSPAYQGPTKRGVRFRWNLLPDVLACLREQVKMMGEAEKNEPSLFGPGVLMEPKPEPEMGSGDAPKNGTLAEILGESVKQFPLRATTRPWGNRSSERDDPHLQDGEGIRELCPQPPDPACGHSDEESPPALRSRI